MSRAVFWTVNSFDYSSESDFSNLKNAYKYIKHQMYLKTKSFNGISANFSNHFVIKNICSVVQLRLKAHNIILKYSFSNTTSPSRKYFNSKRNNLNYRLQINIDLTLNKYKKLFVNCCEHSLKLITNARILFMYDSVTRLLILL